MQISLEILAIPAHLYCCLLNLLGELDLLLDPPHFQLSEAVEEGFPVFVSILFFGEGL